MPIEAELFDYGGVLTDLPSEGFAKIAAAAGADTTELRRFPPGGYGRDGGMVHPWHQIERGEITVDALDDGAGAKANPTRRSSWTRSTAPGALLPTGS